MSTASEALVKRIVVLAGLAVLGTSLAFLLVACGANARLRPRSSRPIRSAGWRTLPAAPIRVDAWPDGRLDRQGDDRLRVRAGRTARSSAPRTSLPPTTRQPVLAAAAEPAEDAELLPPKRSLDRQGDAGLGLRQWRSTRDQPLAPPSAAIGGTGIVVWTGREMIGWGGGCCGDARSDGSAYDPAAEAGASSPAHPSRRSKGRSEPGPAASSFCSSAGSDPGAASPGPHGSPAPQPTTRRPTPGAASHRCPDRGLRFGGTAVWDGREVLVVGAGAACAGRAGLRPGGEPLAATRSAASRPAGPPAVWTGKRLLVWGGTR